MARLQRIAFRTLLMYKKLPNLTVNINNKQFANMIHFLVYIFCLPHKINKTKSFIAGVYVSNNFCLFLRQCLGVTLTVLGLNHRVDQADLKL